MKRKTLTMGSKMAIANAQCNRMGKHGDKACVEHVATGIEKKYKVVKGSAKKRSR